MGKLTFTDAVSEVLDKDVSSIVDEYLTGYRPETPNIDFRWINRYLISKDVSNHLFEIQEEFEVLPNDGKFKKLKVMLKFVEEIFDKFKKIEKSYLEWKNACIAFDSLLYIVLSFPACMANKNFKNTIVDRISYVKKTSKTFGFWYGKKEFWMTYFG